MTKKVVVIFAIGLFAYGVYRVTEKKNAEIYDKIYS